MNVMKAIYLSAALFFFAVPAMAQTNIPDLTAMPGFEKRSFITWNNQPIKQGFTFPGYNIKKLPQDNMPCFVPDVSTIAVMPALKTFSANHAIPNPYFKYNNQSGSIANSLPR